MLGECRHGRAGRWAKRQPRPGCQPRTPREACPVQCRKNPGSPRRPPGISMRARPAAVRPRYLWRPPLPLNLKRQPGPTSLSVANHEARPLARIANSTTRHLHQRGGAARDCPAGQRAHARARAARAGRHCSNPAPGFAIYSYHVVPCH